MKPSDLAKKMGVHPSTVSVWINGRSDRKRNMAYQTAKRLEMVTGIPWATWAQGYQRDAKGVVVLLKQLLKEV